MSALAEGILTHFSKPETEPSHAVAENLEQAKKSLGALISDLEETVRDKVILDLGSGEGWQALAFASAGARHVYGIDIEEDKLERSSIRAKERNLAERVQFTSKIPEACQEGCDLILSRDSMEHYQDPEKVLHLMKGCLRPGGRLIISFGPTWYSPYGAHVNYFLPIPWVHLLFSEESIMNVRSRYRSDGASHYEEVPGGLNRMTVGRFERLVQASGLKVVRFDRHCLRGKNWLGKIPWSREFFINSILCILER